MQVINILVEWIRSMSAFSLSIHLIIKNISHNFVFNRSALFCPSWMIMMKLTPSLMKKLITRLSVLREMVVLMVVIVLVVTDRVAEVVVQAVHAEIDLNR